MEDEHKKEKFSKKIYKLTEKIINKITRKTDLQDEESELEENSTSDVKLDIDESVVYENIKKHNKDYDLILLNYTITTFIKTSFKVIFFIAALVIWVIFIRLFVKSNNIVLTKINSIKEDNVIVQSEIISLVISLIPSLVSVLASFIVIPKTIAEYLFNPKEDIDSIKMIKNLQKYDINFYQKHVSSEEKAVSEKKSTIENKNPQNPSKESPNDQEDESEAPGKTGT